MNMKIHTYLQLLQCQAGERPTGIAGIHSMTPMKGQAIENGWIEKYLHKTEPELV